MGGSGSTAPSGGGGLVKGGECPRKFEAVLVDVIQTGNASYASKLGSGERLNVSITSDESAIALSHGNMNIGYLPPQYNNVIQCIKDGWSYSVSILTVTGEENPQVRVLVIGAP